MSVCPFNARYTVSCMDETYVPQLTDEEIATIEFGENIGEGAFSEVYTGILSNQIVAIKYLKFDNFGQFNNELCMQTKAWKYRLAPEIKAYWICDNQKRAVIVMDYIRGISFRDYILRDEPNIVGYYLRIIRQAVFQNQVVGISHGDLHFKNIFINDDNVLFIDYGNAKQYNNTFDSLYQIGPEVLRTNWGLVSRFFQDLYLPTLGFNITIMYAKKNNIGLNVSIFKLLALLKRHKLTEVTGWFNIYNNFYSEYYRIPNADEVYDIIQNILVDIL